MTTHDKEIEELACMCDLLPNQFMDLEDSRVVLPTIWPEPLDRFLNPTLPTSIRMQETLPTTHGSLDVGGEFCQW